MKNWYKKLSIAIISFLLLITTVSAEGTVILDTTEKSTAINGEVLVLLSLGVAIFAMLIIIKILMLSRGRAE